MNFMSRSAFICIVILLTASAALAQVWPPATWAAPEPAPSWGVTDETAVTVSSFEMLPADGVVINTILGTAKRYIASGPAFPYPAVLPLDLPRGAAVTRIEVEACNEDDTSFAAVYLTHYNNISSNSIVQLGIPPASGCGTFSLNSIPHTVGLDAYVLAWVQSVVGPTQRISLIRVFYKMQVSPAPVTATFGDVPVGNPLHQYVEALVAAGITAGCGEGNYCPNASVTRGQMAVFMAKALGLHWAP